MTIMEMSNRIGISRDTLRYYERIGLIRSVERSKSGAIRRYTEADYHHIEFIRSMRSAGIAIEKLIAYTELCNGGEEAILACRELMIENRKYVLERTNKIIGAINVINRKLRIIEC